MVDSSPLPPRPKKEKRKRGEPAAYPFETLADRRLEKKRKTSRKFFFWAGLILLLALIHSVILANDWIVWKTLDEHGITQLAPLVKTGRHGHGYEAVYRYQNAEYKEEISFERYKTLLNKTTIEIITAENFSRITGTRPNFRSEVIFLGILWIMSFLSAFWGIHLLAEVNLDKTYFRLPR